MVLVRVSFMRLPVLALAGQTFPEIRHELCQQTGLPLDLPLLFCLNGRICHEEEDASCPEHFSSSTVLEVNLRNGLPGGKGGFGSMLRALGAQIEKTTNKEACRDLSGRRLRDINEEDRLKNYVSKKADREREEREKKEAKLAKLRRLANAENKHEFHDPKYAKEREEATDRVHEAMEAAFKTGVSSNKDSQPSTSDKPSEPGPSGASKRKIESNDKAGPSAPKKEKALWLGVDLTESDLESSSSDEEEEEVNGVKVKSVVEPLAKSVVTLCK